MKTVANLLVTVIALAFSANTVPATASTAAEGIVDSDYIRQSADPSRIEIVPDPAGSARQVFHMRVNQTDPKTNGGLRSEVLRRGEYKKEGLRWYAMSVFIPNNWASDRRLTIISQIHTSQKTLRKVPPPISFTVRNDEQMLALHGSTRNLSKGETVDRTSADEKMVSLGALKKGAWQCFVVRADWSWTPGKGSLDIWRNGEKIYTAKDSPNAYESDLGNYPKTGLYEPGGMEVPTREIFADAIHVAGAEASYDEMYQKTPCAK